MFTIPADVPSFFLYGEAPRAVDDRFLHVEDLDDRTRPSDWVIRPHAHTNLNHVFFISAGAGTLRAETESLDFHAPCLITVPARTVHAFRFRPDASGRVLTIADAYLEDLYRRDPDLRQLLSAAATIALENAGSFDAELQQLNRELAWNAPGHISAVEGRLLNVLVACLRSIHHARCSTRDLAGPQSVLVARFRTLVEERFREGLALDVYAGLLRVSPSRLRAACRKTASLGPTQIIQNRILLEARRLLLYSNMSIAEVGYALGFQDPAYFSRFFSRISQESPIAFRRRRNDG